MAETLGKRIGDAIKRAGLTHAEAGRLLGYSRQAVGNWVTGVNDVSSDILARIAEITGTTTDELLGRTDPLRPTTGPGILCDERDGLRIGGTSTDSKESSSLSEAATGNWEGLAHVLAAALAQHEETEKIRAQAELAAREAERFAREADLIAHRTVEATVSRLLSGVAVGAPANSEGARTSADPSGEDERQRRATAVIQRREPSGPR